MPIEQVTPEAAYRAAISPGGPERSPPPTVSQWVTGSPSSSTRLTLESLLHWEERIATDLAVLEKDIAHSEQVAIRHGLLTGSYLKDLAAMQVKKTKDLAAVRKSIAGITRDVDCASSVVRSQRLQPVLDPRRVVLLGSQNPLSMKEPLTPSARTASVYVKVPAEDRPVRSLVRFGSPKLHVVERAETIRNAAKRSPILANSQPHSQPRAVRSLKF